MDELRKRITELEKENAELRAFKQSTLLNTKTSKLELLSYFEEIADQVPGHLACVDIRTLKYLYVNKAFQRSFSIPQEKIIGSHIKDIIGENNYRFALKYIAEVKKGKKVSYENTFMLSSGRRWVKVNYEPGYNSQGEIVTILVLSYDITEKKEAEIALKVSEEKFRLLIEESSDPFFSFTPEGKYIYVNKAFAKGLHKDQNFLIGRTIWDVFEKHEADKRFEVLKKVFDTGEIQTIDVHIPTANGDTFFLTTVTPVHNNEGEIISAICVSKDITRLKRIEAELKESEEILRISNATKDKFFSILAHDLKNPFNALIGLTQLLYESAIDEDKEQMVHYAKAIHTSSQRTHKLLENLLEWSSTQTGRIEFKPELIQLEPLVNEITELYQNTIKSKSIAYKVDIPGKLIVFADKNMMHTIIRNLVMNALKFTRSKGKVSITAEPLSNDVLVTVSDSGIGIQPEHINKLFSISEKIVSPDADSNKGTGLGLILCKEFIDKHGGKIWVESEYGTGSKFCFTIPNK